MKMILLASQSPRRARLLEQIRVPYEVLSMPSDDVEEAMDMNSLPPHRAAESLAEAKLELALGAAPRDADAVILCADTIVVAGENVLGKPADAGHAARMLRALSGRAHEVITAVALHDLRSGNRCVFHERTEVVFRDLEPGEIERYANSGHPLDKAGAYGIQGLAGAFVSQVRGCYSNVVGLPLSHLSDALKNEFDFDVTRNW